MSPARPKTASQFDLAKHPILLNCFFISIPLISVGLEIYFTILTNNIFNKIFDLYLTIDAILSQSIDSGVLPSLAQDLELSSLATQIQKQAPLLSNAWSKLFIVHTTFVILMIIVSYFLFLFFVFSQWMQFA